MEKTNIICPLSGGLLIHIGETSNGLVHYYESDLNRGLRYKRYRLDWTVFEISNRYFCLDGNEMVEVQKIGDKWLSLNATEEEKNKVLKEHSKRQLQLMQKMTFPIIKNASVKTISEELVVVLPSKTPSKNIEFEYGYSSDKNESTAIIDRNARPNISVDDCEIVEYITGKICVIDKNNINDFIIHYPDVLIGDVVYAWDMGGWGSLCGRAGHVLFRNNEYISSKLLRMS